VPRRSLSSADFPFLGGRGKAWIEVIPYPQGLKPSLNLGDLRGAEAPLYHGAAGVNEFLPQPARIHQHEQLSKLAPPIVSKYNFKTAERAPLDSLGRLSLRGLI
jgi:hypothetical protein